MGAECAKCHASVHVPDGLEFGDNDMCWACLNDSHAKLLAACTKAVHDLDHPEEIHPRSRHTLSLATQQKIREAIAGANGVAP